ncbi:MAG: cell wall hydrolase [Mesorhizobium sp.]|nr:MAG: cell wall hydrolase [Mesorhizobium sp.]
MIVLTPTDVLNLKKIASTEVVASLKGEAFTSQTHAVIDTVLNRLASGKWGDTVAEVGNSRWQFSGINSNLPTAYGSLEKMPARHIKAKVAREVDSWLAERAAGVESSVGNHLNYLNPSYSSAKSLKGWGWAVVQQAKKEGLVFGAGRAKHYHGTSADNEPWRPGEFLIALEGLAFNG